MFANRFTALLDANVLAPTLTRNLLLSLAEAEFFRPRWSEVILDECERAIQKICANKEISNSVEASRRARAGIETAFDDAMVTGFASIQTGLSGLPDHDDAHVLAAAIQTSASVIVTNNLKHFPPELLETHGLEAKNANDFLADTIDLSPEKAAKAVKKMRERLKNPALTADDLFLKMEALGLGDAADLLCDHASLI